MTPEFRIGCVSYANAVPLVEAFRDDPSVEVVLDVPSRLPALLESGEVDAILVSSLYALNRPDVVLAEATCIASDGPVESVRLFSKVLPSEIKRLALDQSSMTSNALAQMWLREVYGCVPEAEPMPPSLDDMLLDHDAAVLIGDLGMAASLPEGYVIDLGAAWTDWTGLPFLWAGWIGRQDLSPRLVSRLAAAGERPIDDALIQRVAREHGWSIPALENYYSKTMVYRLSDDVLRGYREFARRLGGTLPELRRGEELQSAGASGFNEVRSVGI
ncbi:MAG: menaquinone biosynthesis protein [Armatimonadetes bacterium]|nr:menaquinone biosynthesis protein [Armatimonadota bacterium]